MNWKLILPLWLFGPAMGTLVVLGVFPEGTDRYAWFVIVAATAFVCAHREPERALLHAAVTGFFNGASATMIQALFLDSMVKNNPFVLEKFAGQPVRPAADPTSRDAAPQRAAYSAASKSW
jgi:hypothetical protein